MSDSSEVFHNNVKSLFPTKLSMVAAIATASVFFATFTFCNNLLDDIEQMNNVHIPLIEVNSTSVRLTDKMQNIFDQAINSGTLDYLKKYAESKNSFLFNQVVYNDLLDSGKKFSSTKTKPNNRGELFKIEKDALLFRKQKDKEEIEKFLLSKNYYEKRSQYENNLSNIVELLTTEREAESSRNANLFSALLIFIVSSFFIVGALWFSVYSAFCKNVKRAINAEESLNLERARSQQQSKLATLGEMAAGIAHEINNPLTVISLSTSKLKKFSILPLEQIDKKKIEKSIGKIEKMNDRIKKIVATLKMYSRDASQDPLAPVTLKSILEDSVVLCEKRFINSDIEFSKPKLPDSFEVLASQIEISQVLVNLLNNSFDAIEGLTEKWIRIEAEEEGSNYRISVIDSGRGISEELSKKIWEPFFTTKSVDRGTGIGLSISRDIIRKHNGDLIIDTSSQNTKIDIVIPKYKNEQKKRSA